MLPEYPSETDLTREERHLAAALRGLEASIAGGGIPDLPTLSSLRKATVVSEAAAPYLERVNLMCSLSPRDLLRRRIVTLALAEQGYI